MATDPARGPSALARFDEMFTLHQRAVLAYAARRTANLADAEDVAAETFTIAWRKLASVPEEPAVLLWLYAVARRVLANHHRGAGRRDRLATILRQQPDVPTPLRLGQDHDGPALQALASLSPADQEVLRLVAWEGLGNQEIASVLDISTNAVAIRLHRARGRFAEALGRFTDGGSAHDLKSSRTSRTSGGVKGTEGAAWKGTPK